jgi:8-oxo-dGTP pyrophosphatase MutT (NUDIX family)
VPTRDFTVAVLVVRDGRILLHWHAKLGRWLPPGGHIEPDEVPDVAAIREVMEETGVRCSLISAPLIDIDLPGQPRQLARPLGIQLADIGPGHQHIDLVYLARGESDGSGEARWLSRQDLDGLELTEEVRAWCRLALAIASQATEPTPSETHRH